MDKKSLLIDGNALLYKAFHASYFPWLKEQERQKVIAESQGIVFIMPEANNAIRTFTMMMLSLKKQFNEHNILVAFDAIGVRTYRNKFNYYKAGRNKTPEDLYIQKPSIIRVLDLLGFEHIEDSQLEADDIIGILAKKFSKDGIQVDIVTGDKDLLQLVDININVYLSKKGVSEMEKYTFDNFSSLMNGLTPEQIKDLKGLMGDNSDNLEGIKGIGEKGAIKLLNEYKSLEDIYINRKKLTPLMCKKIEEGYEHGVECKSIATIITEHNIGITYEQTSLNNFEKYELSSFLRSKNIFKLAEDIENL